MAGSREAALRVLSVARERPGVFPADIRVTIAADRVIVEQRWLAGEAGDAARLQGRAGSKEIDLTKLPKVNLFERADDWSSCMYFYLDRPENGLAALAPAKDRMQ